MAKDLFDFICRPVIIVIASCAEIAAWTLVFAVFGM